MRPQLLKVPKSPDLSFSIRRDFVPDNNNWWHYHTEMEIIHFKKGEGTHFIGDYVNRFNHGDVVLIGSTLPHYTRFDDEYFNTDKGELPDLLVCHFRDDFWGKDFLQIPESIGVSVILEKAKRGIKLTGEAAKEAAHLLEQLLVSEGLNRVILLLKVLGVFAASKQLVTLASIGFQYNLMENENSRINDVYEYSIRNFKTPIKLEKISGIANMSPHSFCRYFKSRTKKTYSEFLIELRVGHACKLLIKSGLSIKQVCYESGFNNLTSFHKQFKQITGKSPLTYQKEVN